MTILSKITISICIAIFFGFGWYALGSLFWTPQTQEQRWVREMDERCRAVYGRGTYIIVDGTRTYECWQRPAFRRPKKVFVEVYI